MHFEQLGENMNTRTRPTVTPEPRLEAAQWVVDQKYSIREAAEAMGMGKSTMDKWVRQLRIDCRTNVRNEIFLF